MKKVFVSIVLAMVSLPGIAQEANRFDILITEIMPIPSPAVGLPAAKYVELKNVSDKSINLKNWKLCSSNSTATISTNITLKPDSFLVICTSTNLAALSKIATAISVTNFPTLYADGDEIFITSPSGKNIHTVTYNRGWFQNEIKSKGGWSLEMIDTQNPCSGGNNWAASINDNGGTPGKTNSVKAINKDITAPKPLKAFANGNNQLSIIFNEPVDSATATFSGNYTLTGNNIQSASVLAPSFTNITVFLEKELQINRPYELTVKNIGDCSGNIMEDVKIKTGLPSHIDSLDVVINEILFNPTATGVDYVELYNRSSKILDLKEMYIANCSSSSGNIGSIKQLTPESRLLFPGDYLVVSENSSTVQKEYLVKDPEAMVELSSMPSYPNESGTCVLLNKQGQIVDELKYADKWHFELITNPKGVALERIDFDKPTQDKNNWHSAAASVGYGTPTYKNSQFKTATQETGNISVSPSVFSPDNDGFDDFAIINYHFAESGNVCNITIFDANGRPVKYLVKNGLCGHQGYFRWDGLDEQNRKLSIGTYIIYTEIFNMQGRTESFKNTVVLARRLR